MAHQEEPANETLPSEQKKQGFGLDNTQRWQALLRGQIINATTTKFMNGIQLADQKAQALILMNSILIPVALNWIEKPQFHIGAIICIITCLISIFAAIICIYPKRKPARKSRERMNLLHFNDIGHMSREEYLDIMRPIFNDPSQLAQLALKDLHDVSKNAMIPKFFWLKVAYTIFFLGNLCAVTWSLGQFWQIEF